MTAIKWEPANCHGCGKSLVENATAGGVTHIICDDDENYFHPECFKGEMPESYKRLAEAVQP